MDNFSKSVRKKKDSILLISSLLGIVAEYFSCLYSGMNTVMDTPFSRYSKNPSRGYVLSHVAEYIKQNYCKCITVADIAGFCHCSESHINHIFKKSMQENVKSYINRLRIKKAKMYLRNTDYSISEIADKLGFNDPNYFSSVFSRNCGIPPTKYRKQAD